MYDPDIHHRKSIRLKEYDYSQSGMYFVTICTHKKELYFEEYPILKSIVEIEWTDIPNRFSNIELDEFIIMPNHLHGIIVINELEKRADAALEKRAGVTLEKRAGVKPAPTLGEIMGSFKSLCAHKWLKYIKENNIQAVGKFWQRNYYERIIRNEKELYKIREYIINNPLNWNHDEENPFIKNNRQSNP